MRRENVNDLEKMKTNWVRLKEFSRDVASALPFPDVLYNFHVNVGAAFSRLCFFRGRRMGSILRMTLGSKSSPGREAPQSGCQIRGRAGRVR